MAKILYHEPPKEEMHHDDDEDTLDGASEPDGDDGSAPQPATAPNPPENAGKKAATAPDPPENAGKKAAKAFGMGLACIVGIPVVAALATVGGVVYGAGKVLEGVGSGLAAGPAAVYNMVDSAGQAQETTEAPKQKPKPKSKPKSQSKSKESKSQ